MKGIKALLWSALLGTAVPGFCSDVVLDTPQDYAAGVMLETTASSPWYQVTLPQAVYQQSVWPDLRDVRVFNRQGDRVPFALEVQKTQVVAPDPVILRLFPLDMSPVPSRGQENRSTEAIVLRSKSGVEIHLESDDVKSIGQTFLLTLPEKMTGSLDVSQLRLNWSTQAGNWQGTASLYYSRDLRSWASAQENAPLMDLSRGNDRLKLDTIAVNRRLSMAGYRYLLLILDSKNPALTLNSVSAITDVSEPESARIALNATVSKTSETQAVWQWKQPQPLTSLRVELDDEGVLPVELAWRSGEKEAWQPLTQTVLYHLDNKLSGEINVPNQLVEAIQLTTINARLPESLPTVTGMRDRYQLVFNAQGAGPFMLAWGNRAAQKADSALDMLIPASLRESQSLRTLPHAVSGESVTLGGEARLTATSAAEEQQHWKTLLVWAVLIIGVMGLALMAWRIWRELKKDGAA